MTDFLAMGGYAAYVWGSFGVTALLVLVEILLLRRRRRTLLRRAGRTKRNVSMGVET